MRRLGLEITEANRERRDALQTIGRAEKKISNRLGKLLDAGLTIDQAAHLSGLLVKDAKALAPDSMTQRDAEPEPGPALIEPEPAPVVPEPEPEPAPVVPEPRPAVPTSAPAAGGQWGHMATAPMIDHQHASKARKVAKPDQRHTIFADPNRMVLSTGRMYSAPPGVEPGGVGAVLQAAAAEGARRVYLTGELPGLDEEMTDIGAVSQWLNGTLPIGWTADPEGHYVGKQADVFTGKYVGPQGQKVNVLHASGWFGPGAYSPVEAHKAMTVLAQLIAREGTAGFGDTAILMDTCSTTGRALWQRTIPAGTAVPVLSAEVRQLLGETSGQGRRELFAPPAPDTTVHDFTHLDGRLMYGALLGNLPSKAPKWITETQLDELDAKASEKVLRGRSWWRVLATVPADWDHLGLLPLRYMDQGRKHWTWPDQPGRTFETWASGAEVWLAMSKGWEVRTLEGLTWEDGHALDLWRDKLRCVWRDAVLMDGRGEIDRTTSVLVQKAVRSLLIHTVGAFYSRGYRVRKTAPLTSAHLVPDGYVPDVQGDTLVWYEHELKGWSEDLAHPEWSVQVWGRARSRLAECPTSDPGQKAGFLYLDKRQIIGTATDALYVAGDPRWADGPWNPARPDKAIGTYRRKGTILGRVPWPENYQQLYALRDMAPGRVFDAEAYARRG
jgi:hypothetical protein